MKIRGKKWIKKEGKWIFVSNMNAADDGLNDAGVETFSANPQEANIREIIQNAIDQISLFAIQNNLPVVVEFDDFTISSDEFPNSEQFKDILKKCILSSGTDNNVKVFFKQALSLMDKPIRVLRISDFNTTGLKGAETGKKGEPWYSLIKSKGSSNKNMSSGGSFGIGKSAPFGCSLLRTVFYVSKSGDIESYIGVSRLISFEDEGITTIGTGYFTEDEKLNAILESFSFNKYSRNENGTDIYIMGYDGDKTLKDLIIETTIKNFFVSIHKGLLQVRYKDIEINKNNIGQYIAELDDKKFSDIKIYYELLGSNPSPDNENVKKIILDSNEFGKEFGIMDGECTLLLMRGDDLNRRILMTRQPGMSLFLQSGISGSISFTGILLINGDKMNELFKTMEMPAHDAWEPERCKVDKKKYVKAYEKLRKYLREKVNECFGQTKDDMITAYGMEEFFSSVGANQDGIKTNVLEGKTKTKLQRNKPHNRKEKPIVPTNGEDGGGIETPPVSPEPAEPRVSPIQPEPPVSPIPPEPSVPPKSIKYKYVDLRKWLLCKNERNGEYTLRFKIEKKKKAVKLEFIGVGETGSYPLNLLEVSVNDDKLGNISRKDNVLLIEKVPKNSTISVDFRIDFDRKIMMEVNYYEA